uniref:Uncharacterized protein n=1 Tax=Knipowitschia caucasica TaxID=637954 RepID=A0AAV2KSH2_KNICA
MGNVENSRVHHRPALCKDGLRDSLSSLIKASSGAADSGPNPCNLHTLRGNGPKGPVQSLGNLAASPTGRLGWRRRGGAGGGVTSMTRQDIAGSGGGDLKRFLEFTGHS